MAASLLLQWIETEMDQKFADRRAFIGGLGAAALAMPVLLGAPRAEAAAPPFVHGVASGDPLAQRVILWTRVTVSGDANPRVQWEMALDAAFTRPVRSGLVRTSATRDFTVKVDVDGLSPDTVYHYRFTYNGTRSPVGRTRTLPVVAREAIRLAVFSCSNYPAGYFHAYAQAARMADLHAAVHLGDFIYEYGRGGYASDDAAAMGREVLPPHECVSLSDYRIRHAQYRTDPGLQALMASVPMIAVWDDHEVCNNTYLTGAANHTAGVEGDYVTRRDAALKAYHEWLPVRTPDTGDLRRIYRSFDFADVLSLHMLETRLLARTEQLSAADFVGPDGINAAALYAAANAPDRALLGGTQLAWLQEQMAGSRATWQVLGQQVLMGHMDIPAAIGLGQISVGGYEALTRKATDNPGDLTRAERYILDQPVVPWSLDAWSGYGAEREAVFAAARRLDRNLVVLAGDTHNAWANDLVDQSGQPIGVEFATPGVSSPGMEASRRTDDPDQLARWMVGNVPHLRYAETRRRGFMVVSATREACQSTWYFVDTVKSDRYRIEPGPTWQTLPGTDQRRLLPLA